MNKKKGQREPAPNREMLENIMSKSEGNTEKMSERELRKEVERLREMLIERGLEVYELRAKLRRLKPVGLQDD